MKKIFPIIIMAVVAMLLTTTACINDEYTTSASDVLTFSTDTVTFDTVITQQGTPTKQFIVYNRSSKQVKISSIKVAGNDNGRFFINVDGVKGSEFHDVDIRGGDSIYVFVECKVNATENLADLLEVTDSIQFVTNGVAQHVVLKAWGQDVNIIHGDTLKEDLQLTAEKPYVIYDTLTVPQGVTLTIDPGAQLLFHKGALLRVYGQLLARGTAEQNIVMRGDRLDKVVGDISFDIMSGQWGGIVFGYGSYGNEMTYVVMRSSEIGIHCSSTDPQQRTLYLLNSVIHNSSSSLLTSLNARIDAEGTEFSDAADGVVHIIGGTARFVNCTLANYYLFAAISEPIVNVWKSHETEQVLPLTCYLDNCVIYGLAKDINAGVLDDYDVYLRNCLLKSAGSDDAHFINCVWEGDPKFYTVREDYIFDYRLHNGSDAIGRGDRSLCPESARYDRYGNDRYSSDAIDLGAYVWIPEPEE